MNPRLKSSKKWTAFPQEYAAQIQQAFRQSFQAHLKNSQLIVEGRIYTEEILLRVGVLENGRLAQANFEVSMLYSTKSKDAVDRIHDCVDAAASMMNEFFQSGAESEVDFPRTWKEYEFNGKPLYLQFSTVNTELEAQADALLGESASDLVRETEDVDDALDRADSKIEASENSDQDLSGSENSVGGPQMFGGRKKKKSDLH